jgi:hypothetical protein
MRIFQQTCSLTARFLENRSGNFGLVTALIMVPLLVVTGGTVDVSMAFVSKADMQYIADSAALAGGAVYDGTNTDVSIAQAESYLRGYKTELLEGATYDVSMDGQNLQVVIAAKSPNSFLTLAGMSNINIDVLSQTIAPMKPKSVTFTPTKSQGYYYKKVSIIVVRPNSTAEEIVGTVEYQPITHDDGGQGPIVVKPSTIIDLGKYSSLILQMDIKNDGCSVGQKAEVTGSDVSCAASRRDRDVKFDLTLRTDNPDASHYLFVDGKQLPKGTTSPLSDILVCGKTSNHAWEDGGGWARQDFFYTAKSVCAPDGQFVRLTK